MNYRDLAVGVLLSMTHRWCFLPDFRGKYRIRAHLLRFCKSLQLPGHPVPLRLRSGIKIWADVHHGMARWIISNDVGEGATTRVLDEVLRPGDFVVDVGANIGYFSLLSAQRVWPGGRVYAFEPGTWARAAMTANLALNPVGDSVALIGAAVGQISREAVLRLFGKGSEHVAVLSEQAIGESESERVQVVALDSQSQRFAEPVKLVKIDVEGREWDVLRGAEMIIRTWRPYVIAELSLINSSRFGLHPAEVTEWLIERSYELYTIRAQRIPYDRSHLADAGYIDILAVPR